MSQQELAKMELNCEYTTTSATVSKLKCYSKDPFGTIIQRFRLAVPQLSIPHLRAATSSEEISQVLAAIKSPSGFVLFAEYNHAGWMRHFSTLEQPLQRAHRFTFGNPLYALPVLQQNIEAALQIPLDCCFIEEQDGKGARMIFTRPTTLVESIDCDHTKQALEELEIKLLTLICGLVAGV